MFGNTDHLIPTLGEIATGTAAHIHSLIHCAQVSITVFDFGASTFTTYTYDPVLENGAQDGPYSLDHFPASLNALMCGEICQQEISAENPAAGQAFWGMGVRSASYLPIFLHGKLFGTLNLGFGASGAPPLDDILLTREIANHLSTEFENRYLVEKDRKRAQELEILHDIDLAILSHNGCLPGLQVIIEKIVACLGVDAGAILVLDRSHSSLWYGAGIGFHTDHLRSAHLQVGEGLAGQAARTQKVISTHALVSDDEAVHPHPAIAEEGFCDTYAIPLFADDKLIGVLDLFHRSALHTDAEWIELAQMLATQAAIAVETANLSTRVEKAGNDLSQAYDATIVGWSRALDLRDQETEDHTLRVAEMVIRFARMIGAGEDELAHIWRGSLLHDIGKLGIPDAVLLKPGELTPEEWVLMRTHPQLAHDLLEPIEFLRPALDIPYCHHERWDGTGYPRGLKGEEIPFSARLFAVIDVYDALTSDRPYRKAWPKERAVAHIVAQSGRHFDPQIVTAFLRFLDKGTPDNAPQAIAKSTGE